MPQIPASERKLMGRAGAYQSWANTTDRSARTAPARARFDATFLEQAEGDPARADALRKAHFARLALKSAQARRRAKQQTVIAEAAEAELADLGGGAA
jgi:hypothetical protein